MNDVSGDRISEYVKAYNDTVYKESQKMEEIRDLKAKIQNLEVECSELRDERQHQAIRAQAEVYTTYREKDLLKMVSRVEKIANIEIAEDFRKLVDKFSNHEMQINDVAQLHTYCKIYGTYVKKENGLIKGVFRAFGGNLDD